ncbi:MAG: MBL fold metallo-hydrolase [Pseudomonadota bacterium]|nr:MBL fold metallo-hydrolase [Pseudomonadota bacterium]
MSNREYKKGLHDLGNGCWAYIVPDGSYGWSNAGIIADGGETLLVDTLFDLHCTREMLAEMREKVPGADKIDILVNSHADGDHIYGNELVEGARIIASKGTAEDFARFDPGVMASLMRDPSQFGKSGAFVKECFGVFDFEGITLTAPTETFSGRMTVEVGSKTVELIEVGPAHSLGDTLIYVPEDKVLYAADILFSIGTPIAWYGPIQRWIDACDLVLDMEIDVIVAGHGPLATKDDIVKMRNYFVDMTDRVRVLFDAGVPYEEAIYKLDLGEYAKWRDPERVVVTIRTLYDDFDAAEVRPQHNPIPFFAIMKDYRDSLGLPRVHDEWLKARGM